MITVKGLTKEFSGFQALKGLNSHVKAGEVYGFICPNGPGKTTTMNILAGLSRPAQGKCVANEIDVTKLTLPSWIWFTLTSIIISLLVMLFSGSLQIKRNMRADAPLDVFKAHMDERIPALMK